VETHRKVFLWVLGMLAEEGLLACDWPLSVPVSGC
jgi:hypothetical protein